VDGALSKRKGSLSQLEIVGENRHLLYIPSGKIKKKTALELMKHVDARA
jgi:hypothetical protein